MKKTMENIEEIIKDIYGNEYRERIESLKKGKKITSQANAAAKIRLIDDSLSLHCCAEHFDPNEHCIGGSLEIPKEIINNPCCDLGTAMLIFYKLGGVHFLYDLDSKPLPLAAKLFDRLLAKMGVGFDEYNKKCFLAFLCNSILAGSYPKQEICYAPAIGRVEKDTLQRRSPNCPAIFLEKTPGCPVNLPKVWYKPMKAGNR